MKEKRVVIGVLSGVHGHTWVVDVVKLADHDGDAIDGVGFLTTDTVSLANGTYDPVQFDNGQGKMFMVVVEPFPITCYVRQYEEGEPTSADIAYATMNISYSTTN